MLAHYQQYQLNPRKTGHLAHSFALCLAAFEIREAIRSELQRPESKLAWQEKQISTAELGAKTALTLFDQTGEERYLDEAFRFVERIKARALLEELDKKRNLAYAGVPGAILDSIRHLESLTGYYELQLFESAWEEEAEKENKTREYQNRLLAKVKAWRSWHYYERPVSTHGFG